MTTSSSTQDYYKLRINNRRDYVDDWKHTVYDSQGAYEITLPREYVSVFLMEKGGSSMVCQATKRGTDQRVAIKVHDLTSNPQLSSILREIQISTYLTMKKSKATVQLKDIQIHSKRRKENKGEWYNKQICLIYEYMKDNLRSFTYAYPGDLNRNNNARLQLKDHNYRRLLAHLLFGIRDMHHANILHRDIKPSNLLVNKSPHERADPTQLKICDFGLARAMKTSHTDRVRYEDPFMKTSHTDRVRYKDPFEDSSSSDDAQNTTAERKIITGEQLEAMRIKRKTEGLTNRLGTPGYRSPELTLGCVAYQKPADIWAVGCVFAEMVQKKQLFKVPKGATNEDEFNKIISKFGSSFISGELDFIDNKEGHELANKKKAESIIGKKLSMRFQESLDRDGIKLLKRLLKFDPNTRITAQNALRSKYLKDIYEELRKEFVHLDLDEKFETENEQSEEQLTQKIWDEIEDFRVYNEREREKVLKENNEREREKVLKENNDERKRQRIL